MQARLAALWVCPPLRHIRTGQALAQPLQLLQFAPHAAPAHLHCNAIRTLQARCGVRRGGRWWSGTTSSTWRRCSGCGTTTRRSLRRIGGGRCASWSENPCCAHGSGSFCCIRGGGSVCRGLRGAQALAVRMVGHVLCARALRAPLSFCCSSQHCRLSPTHGALLFCLLYCALPLRSCRKPPLDFKLLLSCCCCEPLWQPPIHLVLTPSPNCHARFSTARCVETQREVGARPKASGALTSGGKSERAAKPSPPPCFSVPMRTALDRCRAG